MRKRMQGGVDLVVAFVGEGDVVNAVATLALDLHVDRGTWDWARE
jgi:hypothetical protein